MTEDRDILAKFKLITDPITQDSITSKVRESETVDIFEGFLDSVDDSKSDLFDSFLNKITGSQKNKPNYTPNLFDNNNNEPKEHQIIQQNTQQEVKKLNFVQKVLNLFFANNQAEAPNQQVGQFVFNEEKKDLSNKKSSSNIFTGSSKSNKLFVDGFSTIETDEDNIAPNLEEHLINKVSKIAMNYQTDEMEDIIKSDELSKSELEKLFINYFNKSTTESPENTKVLNKILVEAKIPPTIESITEGKVDKTQLQEIFIDFIKETSESMEDDSLRKIEDRSAVVISEFAAAINTENMTRDELEELFIRFLRQLSIKHPAAFNELASVLSNSLSKAFDPYTGSLSESSKVIDSFRLAINPEFMTREDLEEIFIRFVRELSIGFPEVWAEMQQILSNAIAVAFSPDTTMDDQSRAAIANFRMAISPENMTRDELEELFLRFSREVSVNFPAAWAELQSMLSVAVANAYEPDTTIDDPSKAAIAGFSLAIKPEFMTREELEELFIRFAREISVKFPAAWAELQGMLSAALSNAFVPDMTMDDESSAAIAGFSLAIKPEFMKKEELEELFIRFARQVSVHFPAALDILNSILSQALPNAYVKPIPEMDDHSVNIISSFQLAIKPEEMTKDKLGEVFTKYVAEISSKYPSAHLVIQSILNSALASAYEPNTTIDEPSKAAIAGFSLAIKPEFMTREELEELFVRFAREISVKYPAAWAELQSMLNLAVAGAYEPDTTMDDPSRAAISNFSLAIKPEFMTREELEELFLRFSREVSVNFPAAWAELQSMLSVSVASAYEPDTTIDDPSKAAIAGFSLAIKPEFMTKEELEELFIRFAREISVKYPAAWAELQGMLNMAVVGAFEPDTTMDDPSRAAISGFSLVVKPDDMTREEIEELFSRFAREVSINFPAAWAELQGMLSVSVANAFVPDTTMDDPSRGAISGFSIAVKPEAMTREELEELFVRCAREISVKFPAAWAELQGMLNEALPNAFVPDTSMDDSSKSAIIGFSMSIKPESMTKKELEELFLRFTKEISTNFPAAWAELQGTLNNALPYAFVPDTTMDESSKHLMNEFETTAQSKEFSEKQLEGLFTDFLRQVPLKFPVVKSIMENITNNKRGEAKVKDNEKDKTQKDFDFINKDFEKITEEAKDLDLQAQEISQDLKLASDKDGIDETRNKLGKIMSNKGFLDSIYANSMINISSNLKANQQIKDSYVQNLNLSFEKKDDRELFEIETEKLESWDMLRMLRREEVLDVLNDMPQEELVESLYVIPKHLLKQALVQLPVEEMCKVLFNARFPEALLRSMPRNAAIEMLPAAEEVLPILMNMGRVAGFKNGCDLLEEVITKGLDVEPAQNATRTQEEVLPFLMEQLIGKTPRNADALHPVQGKINPVQKSLMRINEENMYLKQVNKNKQIEENKNKLKYQKPESLNPKQLESLAQDSLKNTNESDQRELLASKRGDPIQVLEFLESMKKVKDLASAKMAVSVLSPNQAKIITRAALSVLDTQSIVKISQYYGKAKTEMVKEMPRYAIEGLIKTLPKHYMIQGFKLLDKDLIVGLLRTQSSQSIARVAAEMLSRDTVKDVAFKKQGFV